LAELPNSQQLESLGSHGPQSLDNASDQLESPDLPALLDVVPHMPSMDDVAAEIPALEAAPGRASITIDEICQAQATDDSFPTGSTALEGPDQAATQ